MKLSLTIYNHTQKDAVSCIRTGHCQEGHDSYTRLQYLFLILYLYVFKKEHWFLFICPYTWLCMQGWQIWKTGKVRREKNSGNSVCVGWRLTITMLLSLPCCAMSPHPWKIRSMRQQAALASPRQREIYYHCHWDCVSTGHSTLWPSPSMPMGCHHKDTELRWANTHTHRHKHLAAAYQKDTKIILWLNLYSYCLMLLFNRNV